MAVPPQDLYQLLGVDRDALREDIAQAYRIKARAVHPDSRPDDPAAPADFRALAEAYEVLSDPDRRAAYDRTLGSPVPVRTVRAVRRPPGPPLWAGPVRIQGWTGEDWSW